MRPMVCPSDLHVVQARVGFRVQLSAHLLTASEVNIDGGNESTWQGRGGNGGIKIEELVENAMRWCSNSRLRAPCQLFLQPVEQVGIKGVNKKSKIEDE